MHSFQRLDECYEPIAGLLRMDNTTLPLNELRRQREEIIAG